MALIFFSSFSKESALNRLMRNSIRDGLLKLRFNAAQSEILPLNSTPPSMRLRLFSGNPAAIISDRHTVSSPGEQIIKKSCSRPPTLRFTLFSKAVRFIYILFMAQRIRFCVVSKEMHSSVMETPYFMFFRLPSHFWQPSKILLSSMRPTMLLLPSSR